jgi:hypothetical protein
MLHLPFSHLDYILFYFSHYASAWGRNPDPVDIGEQSTFNLWAGPPATAEELAEFGLISDRKG